MSRDQDITPLKRRSFFAAAAAGLAGILGFPLLRLPAAPGTGRFLSPKDPAENAPRISIHPLAVRRNEENEKKHG